MLKVILKDDTVHTVHNKMTAEQLWEEIEKRKFLDSYTLIMIGAKFLASDVKEIHDVDENQED
ncbi:hypothetical protein CW685_01850 [Macrococcoides caseolyticum]|uniref:hypothetical protein n=1 Tax=Macrococcoides caseolyticum TaxID=69966 RepID=UPI000C34809E|nr:hypothetical protein [Macrococcus caseolyticus]PKE12777.1 hypothetical protein CW685_01850 [Macrococcus caseolyticus]